MSDPSEGDIRSAMQAATMVGRAAPEEGRIIGRREGMAKLEQARADIHKSNVREIVATYGLLTIAEVQALLKNRRISTRYGYLTADEILAEVRSRRGAR